MNKILDEFIGGEREGVLSKINRIKNAGKDKLHLVLDFDRTLTPGRNAQGQEFTTWQMLHRHLPASLRIEATRLYEKYRPLEIAGRMTISDAIAWWTSRLDLDIRSGLKWSDLAREIEESMSARPGAKELFEICSQKGIPTIIISAGLRDVIELWCRKFEIKPTLVLSTNLRFDAKGYVCGWDKDSLIHIFNKREKGHQELGAIRQSRPNTILAGDSLDDAVMADGTDDVLRILIDDERADDRRPQDFHKTVFKTFDLIIPGKSLLPLVKIIKYIK
jgi:HAD superfamily hydrolase (TIGR01544 family)